MKPVLTRSVPCEIPVRICRPRLAHAVGEAVLSVTIVVGAIIACTFIHLPSHKLCFDCTHSRADVAHVTAAKFAFEAYPQWQATHPDERCPPSLDDLLDYMDRKDAMDPYGAPYELTCTPKGIVIFSPGEDGTRGTADDIWSDNR